MKASLASIGIHAVPFCYGPATIALGIAMHLKQLAQRTSLHKLEVVAFGRDTARELLVTSDRIDHFVDLGLSDVRDRGKAFEHLCSCDVIVSVGDFMLAKLMQQLGRPIAFVDFLYWMWDVPPISPRECLRYYATDFPGVSERVAEVEATHRPRVVGAPIPFIDKATPREGSLVINFGGVASPLGDARCAVGAMVDCMGRVLDRRDYDRVVICGGPPVLDVCESVSDRWRAMTVASLTHREFLKEASTCSRFVTVPGLAVAFEALALGTPSLFILPLNYSQHRQLAAYREVLANIHAIGWSDLPGYENLPGAIPDEEGCRLAFELGDRFARDPAAQREFEARFEFWLKNGDIDSLALRDWSPCADSGFADIATDLLEIVGWPRSAGGD